MNTRVRKFVLKPHHASVFAFLVLGLTLVSLLIPLRALLNRSSIPEFTSAAAYGSTGSDAGSALHMDASGNQYVAATFNGTVTIGSQTLVSNGSSDVAIFKRAPNGDIPWAVAVGGAGVDGGVWLDADADGGIYLGAFVNGNFNVGATAITSFGSNDAFVGKFNADTGALEWHNLVSSARGELTEGVAAVPGGGAIWTGTFYNTADFGDLSLIGNNDFNQSFVVKLDASGDDVWATMGTSTGNSRATGIAFLSDGRVVISGQYAGTLTYGAYQITSSGGTTDGYITILAADGTPEALYSYGGAGSQTMGPVFVDNQDRVYGRMNYTAPDSVTLGAFTLSATSGTDAALFRIDPADGTVLWAKGLSGTGTDIIYFSTQIDTNSYGLVVTFSHGNGATYDGTSYSASASNDIRIVSLNHETGSPLWVSDPYGSSAQGETMRALTWTGSRYYFTGGTGTATYGSTSVTSAGGTDIWLGTLEYPNRNEVTSTTLRKPGIFSVYSHAQKVGDKAILYRYRLENEGESVLSWPMIRDRSCPAKSVVLGRGDTNSNLAVDPGETWDLFCLKSSFPFFPRTVLIEAEWGSSIISAYTVVDNEEVPYLEPASQQTEGSVSLSVLKETEGTGTNSPSLFYVLQTKEGSKKPVVTDEGCESLTPLWKDKDGVLKKGETWILLCIPKKDTESKPVIIL